MPKKLSAWQLRGASFAGCFLGAGYMFRAGIVAVFRYFRRVVGERACLNTLYDIYFRLFIFATHVCDQLRQYGGDEFLARKIIFG